MNAYASLLVLLSLTWLPSSGADDLAFRGELAQAILDAGTTPHEARLLLRIARWESHYRRDVADCRVLGDRGADGSASVGAWQHHVTPGPHARAEREWICGSLVEAARVARDDVRRSFAVARELPVEERLSVYVAGPAWRTERARRMARVRWWP
jgi:hypothetical protein